MGMVPRRRSPSIIAGSVHRGALNVYRTPAQRKKERLERGDLPVDIEMRYQEELYNEGFGLSFDIE